MRRLIHLRADDSDPVPPLPRSRLRQRLHWGVVAALIGAFAVPVHAAALAKPPATIAGPGLAAVALVGGPVEAAGDGGMIEVVVDEAIPRAPALRARIVDDVTRVLQALAVELGGEHSVRLAIGVAGAAQNFRVGITVFRDGAPVTPVPEPFDCECTLEELRGRIDKAVVALVPVLEGRTPAVEPTPPVVVPTPAPTRSSAPEPNRRARRVPLGTLGKAGIGVLVVGGIGVVVGGVLVGLGARGTAGALEGGGETTDLEPPGFAVLAVGLGGLVVAAVLLGVDRARARRRPAPAALHRVPRLTDRSLKIRF